MALSTPPGFDDLSLEEKVDYVSNLWDAILDSGRDIPVPDWHRDVIADRLAQLRDDPDSALPWDDVRDELRRKYPTRT